MIVHARGRGPPGGDNLQSYIFTNMTADNNKERRPAFLVYFLMAVKK